MTTESADLDPAATTELIGHQAAEATLAEAWRRNRLAHAWLITGPRGVGKATLAYRFARYVLAGGGTSDSLAVDMAARDARLIVAGSHPNLLVIERGEDPKTGRRRSEIVVADARRLGAFLSLTAADGGWRVVIIDGAESLNRHAANAILKVAEEAPAKSLILLTSHLPGRLLATIRSRCRELKLAPLDEGTVLDLLRQRMPDLSDADAGALARLARGSPGAALGLAALDGVTLYRGLLGLVETLPRLDVAALHAFADQLSRRGAEASFDTAMGLLAGWLSSMIAARARGAETVEIVAGEGALAQRLGEALALDQWLALWEKVSHLTERTGRINLDRKQVVLTAFTSIEAAMTAQ